MKAAPGGQLPVEDIFGRDQFIADLWQQLDAMSIRLEAERRIGKTHVLNKMNAQPPAGWEPILLDGEKVHSASEFAETVCSAVHKRLEGWKRHSRRVFDFLGLLHGSHFGPLKFPDKKAQGDGYWKNILVHAVDDLVEQQVEAGRRVVFFFDEMPWMIAAIAQQDGDQVAMQVLDLLRSLRQSPNTSHGFRMVLCGSVGFHHVLDQLRRAGYRNQPLNDTKLVEVLPLEPGVAAELATKLLAGEGVASDPDAPHRIAEQTGGFPYYIHWIVSELKVTKSSATPSSIDAVVGSLLTAPHDPCNFKHFRKRIDDYYPGEVKVTLALLDHAACNVGALHQTEFINAARSTGAVEDDRVRELLRLLAVDHYLNRDVNGRYAFRHPLLRRWWLLERGLS